MTDAGLPLLRHTLATLAYRAAKTLRDAPPGFGDFRPWDPGRSAVEVVAHMGDLFDWALSIANGAETWRNAKPLAWEAECARFFAALSAFDARLASGEPVPVPLERLFQGPVADALTHTGQIAMMRRLAGSPIKGENYFVAEIGAGRAGAEQAAPVYEFAVPDSARHAVRALLVTPERRILLIRTALPHASRHVWLTPGGGIEPGENPATALGREIAEETGLRGAAIGPLVWTRLHTFRWGPRLVTQSERFYLVSTRQFDPCADALPNADERAGNQGFRWWTLQALASSDERFVPRRLPALLASLLANPIPKEPVDVGE